MIPPKEVWVVFCKKTGLPEGVTRLADEAKDWAEEADEIGENEVFNYQRLTVPKKASTKKRKAHK